MGREMGRATARRAWKGIAAAFVAAVVAGMPGTARADEATKLDPIVVTATRIEQKASEQASSVSVVTREEIELKNPSVAGDVLKGLPGVDVQRTGSPGSRENIKIRGGLAAHTLVMIDGFPVNSPTLGSFDLGSLPVDDFERVEVVRGAQSALYGSGAMGGVVNFIPGKGEGERRYGLGIAGGSFGTAKGNLFARGAGEKGAFRLGAGGWRSDGTLDNDDTSLVSFLGTGEAALGGRSRLHAIMLSTGQEKGIPIDFGTRRDANHRLNRRSFLSGARWETAFSKGVTVSASGMVFDEFFHEKDPGDPGEAFPFVFDDVTKTRKTDFRLEGRFSQGPLSTTFLGVEYGKDRASDTYRSGFGDTDLASSTFNRSIFVQEELRPREHWGLSLGARLDRNSEAGTQFNPKAAIYRSFGEGAVKVRAAAGRGFRVPTISEKRDLFVGNPALSPEVAVSYEGGADALFADRRGRISGTWFYQAYRDLIQFDSSVAGPLGFGQLRNKGRAFSRGVEAEGTYLLTPEAEMEIAYTFSDTWDSAGQKRIIGIPRHRARTSLLLSPSPSFHARADWRVESDQIDAPLNGSATRRPGYARVDLYARYRWEIPDTGFREMALTGRIENLLNRKYEERIEFPAPGINFLLGAEVKI